MKPIIEEHWVLDDEKTRGYDGKKLFIEGRGGFLMRVRETNSKGERRPGYIQLLVEPLVEPYDSVEELRDWWVTSTALCPPTLVLNCRRTGASGIVEKFTQEEWNRAYEAPSNPYPWSDSNRVTIYVMQTYRLTNAELNELLGLSRDDSHYVWMKVAARVGCVVESIGQSDTGDVLEFKARPLIVDR